MTITVGSLFSGIGGIELGLERTGGFKTVWFCENNEYASAVLKKHWPGVPNLGDITEVDWNAIERPEMLTGGFPCQDISVAGKGKGLEGGHRSGLWFEYAKAIGHLRPRIALIENVPAITGRGLDIVLADLAEMRYDAEWFNLSASDVGAWHRRERIFIIAYATGERCDDGGNNRQGGQVLPIEKREAEEGDKEWDRRECRAGEICDDVSHPHEQGLEGSGGQLRLREDEQEGEAGGSRGLPDANNNAPARQREQRRKVLIYTAPEGLDLRGGEEWWAVEPAVDRVAYGVPNRVDRIDCLGNAVVPQVAQAIGEMILKKMGASP